MADNVEINVYDGIPGTNGWSPMLRVVPDGERRVVELFGWTGGSGTKPAITGYLSDTGVTQHIAEATNIRGASGSGGGGSAEWGDISGSIQDQTDLWNELQSKLESIDWDGIDGKPDVIASGATQAAARTSIGLGSAAAADSSEFATAAQGALADTAVQPGDLPATPTWTTISGKPEFVAEGANAAAARTALGLGTAATTAASAYATAAQGALANTAIQPAAIANMVESQQEGGVGTLIKNIVAMTQAQYDGITPKSDTFYIITD